MIGNATPYDRFGNSARRQANYLSAERQERREIAEAKRKAFYEARGVAPSHSYPDRAWIDPRIGDCRRGSRYLGKGGVLLGRVVAKGPRIVAEVGGVDLPDTFEASLQGRRDAKLAVELAVAATA